MTGGNVGVDGGGGVDPLQFEVQIEGQDSTVDDLTEVESKANALPGSDTLGETGGVGGVDDGIPRLQSESTLSGTLSTDSDTIGATGGSGMIAAKQAASGRSRAGSIDAEYGGYAAVMTGSQVAVTGPTGTQFQGEVDDEGVLTLDVQETEGGLGPAHITFREPPNADGELTVQVDPLDGTDPEDITVQVDEVGEGETKPLRRERAKDLEENPEEVWEVIDYLELICKCLERTEQWITEHQGAGKGSGLI